MLKMTLMAAAFAVAAISAPLAANAVTYDFNAPGNYSGSFTLDVVGGQALSGTGTIDVAGYAPEALTLITASTPGAENPLSVDGSKCRLPLSFDWRIRSVPLWTTMVFSDRNVAVLMQRYQYEVGYDQPSIRRR